MSKVVSIENESGRTGSDASKIEKGKCQRNPLDKRPLSTLQTCLDRRKSSALKNPPDASPAGGSRMRWTIGENISMEIPAKSRIAKTELRILLPRAP